MQEELKKVMDQLAGLEKQNRRIKLSLFVVFIAFAVLFLSGAILQEDWKALENNVSAPNFSL